MNHCWVCSNGKMLHIDPLYAQIKKNFIMYWTLFYIIENIIINLYDPLKDNRGMLICLYNYTSTIIDIVILSYLYFYTLSFYYKIRISTYLTNLVFLTFIVSQPMVLYRNFIYKWKFFIFRICYTLLLIRETGRLSVGLVPETFANIN